MSQLAISPQETAPVRTSRTFISTSHVSCLVFTLKHHMLHMVSCCASKFVDAERLPFCRTTHSLTVQPLVQHFAIGAQSTFESQILPNSIGLNRNEDTLLQLRSDTFASLRRWNNAQLVLIRGLKTRWGCTFGMVTNGRHEM